MIKINLLPYREKAKKEKRSKQIFYIAGLFALFILCLLWSFIYFTSQVSGLEEKIASSKESLKILDEKVGDLEKYKKQKMELELKLEVIGKLEENRLLPVKTLDDLSMLVPQKNVWLTKIEQRNNQLRIEGIGRDNIVAADFMKTIEGFAPVASVDLVSSKKVEISGVTLQQFVFACKMKKGF